MTKQQLDDLEDAARRKGEQDLPGVRSSGQVIGMTPEERKAWFDKMREAIDAAPDVPGTTHL